MYLCGLVWSFFLRVRIWLTGYYPNTLTYYLGHCTIYKLKLTYSHWLLIHMLYIIITLKWQNIWSQKSLLCVIHVIFEYTSALFGRYTLSQSKVLLFAWNADWRCTMSGERNVHLQYRKSVKESYLCIYIWRMCNNTKEQKVN